VAEFGWTIPLWPLLGWLVLGFVGGRLPRAAVSLIGCGSVGLACAAAIAAGLTLPEDAQVKVLFPWIAAGTLTVSARLFFDPLAVVMALVVTGVGLLIHVYSVGYMAGEAGYSRYFAYLNLFIGSMLLLVLAGDLLVLFVGWELVGLCSYLLIGFWFDRERAAAAGRKAFLVNRIGDAGFLLGLLVLWRAFGTLEVAAILSAPAGALAGAASLAAPLLLFLGATGKSAQLPLYTWLPDAMEGPTPVSALIHAATMVTAGVYLIARLFPLFAHPPVLAVVAGVGAVTAFFAATIALVEWDLKRVLAYSTISQLGYMFLALGVAAPEAGIFHLVTHAFFKALLFLAAGSVMHAMAGQIDMRALGGLARPLRATMLAFIAGALALAGIPPFAGFVSKDLILERAWDAVASGGNPLLFPLGLLTAYVTAVYIARAARYTFFDAPAQDGRHPHEAPPVMLWPMAVLAVLSVGGGVLGAHLAGAPLFTFLSPVLASPEDATRRGITPGFFVPALSIGAGVLGLLLGWTAYRQRRDVSLGWVGRLFSRHWYLLDLYDGVLTPAARGAARFLAGPVDLGAIDRAVNAIGALVAGGAQGLRRLQTGYVRQYAAVILVGTILVLAYWMAR
jgi:NADH-quinone oxidoreductase subunit L